MIEKRVKVNNIIQSQLPEFVRSEFPLVSEFLKQYYISIESNGNPYDLMNNIDQYVKVDNLANLINSTSLSNDITFLDSTITVESTAGFVDNYGLIQINDEIILYESKTDTTFNRCRRGFSGVTSYSSNTLNDELEFSSSFSNDHSSGDTVINLNAILLTEFFNKIKKQITPGFEDRDFYSELNERLFVKQSNNFYTSKGTKESFRILFGALYGKPVEVILPRDYVFEPSEAKYRTTKDLVVEAISGDPLNLLNATLYQDRTTLSKFARGTVTSVEKITRNNVSKISSYSVFSSEKSDEAVIKNYYILSLDFDYDKDIETRGTTVGSFTIHPKTKIVSKVSTNQTYIDVDSTLGFPESGDLIIDLPNEFTLNVSYSSKTINQFLGCTGVVLPINDGEEVKYDDYAYGTDLDGSQIRVRVTGVVSSVDTTNSHNLLEVGNTIKIKSLGKSDEDHTLLNNWFFNIASSYNIKNIVTLNDTSDFSYEIETYDKNDFKIGNSIYLVGSNGVVTQTGRISLVKNDKIVSIVGQGKLETLTSDSTPITYTIHRKISKVSVENYPNLSLYNSNVSNTYYDNSDDSVYVVSSSLPNYGNDKIRITDLSLSIESLSIDNDLNGNPSLQDINFPTRHSFFTGDLVIIKFNDVDKSQVIGFVKVVNATTIKLSKNKESILANNYINFSEFDISQGGRVEFFKFNTLNKSIGKYETKELQPQRIIRKIKSPESYGDKKVFTESGPIGILLNGVEIQNYKSEDYIYYGKIENITVLDGGEEYDVINPPILQVSDSVGSGCSGICEVKGSLQSIDILDQGFNFFEVPKIEISGGNGTGAKAEVSLISYEYVKTVGITTLTVNGNEITFDSPHNFSTAEEVIYGPGNNPVITGLSTNSKYFVNVVGINTIKLCSSVENVYSDNNLTISISDNAGLQNFRSAKLKRKIGSIVISDPGEGYTNKSVFAYASKSGISTSLDTINIKNHGFKTGEIISYVPESDPIGGLSTSNYYVKEITKDTFRLFDILEDDSPDFNLQSNNYVNLTSYGGEVHEFKYPDIELRILGRYDIPSLAVDSSKFSGLLRPNFKGEIQSITLTEQGSKYGDPEIINFSKQPLITLDSGSGAEVDFVVQNGKIVSVYVTNSGSGYNSPPKLFVNGDGTGAKLSPVIVDGALTEVNVISSGSEYTKQNTSITVVASGFGAKFYSNITSWNINLPKRVPSLINSNGLINNPDDGYISVGRNDLGLQYNNIYPSRLFRSISNAVRNIAGEKIYKPDYTVINNVESDENIVLGAHSPIIGWAYDGNPIYGPYGYRNPNGTGGIKKMASGYRPKLLGDRPDNYELGFFVEDYDFVGSDDSDLDDHNGRYCITPEYPDGVYAYFTTISETLEGSSFLPVFPYIIGNTYKSKPIEFNYQSSSYTNIIDINSTKLIRNTYPYNLTKDNSAYNYFLNSYDLQIDSLVKSTISGSIDSIDVLNGGEGYKVGDEIIFNDDGTNGSSASAYVSKLNGVGINSITSEIVSISGIELEKVSNNSYIGYSTEPLRLNSNQKFNITSSREKNQYQRITIPKNYLRLNVGFGTITETGISTYISVSGNLIDIKENDIYKINSEEIKVIEVDSLSSRLKILRSQNGTNGLSSHFSGNLLEELSRKFSVVYATDNLYRESTNKQLYFDPSESVGIGTSFGVGVTSTLYFSNPGVGNTILTIPTRSIYLKNHGLNTGDLLVYNTNSGDPIAISTNSGITTSNLEDNSEIFVYKISNDLIGISTHPVGLNSVGNITGIGTINSDLLYFTGIGTGTYHSFRTSYNNVLDVEIYKTNVTVSTASSHGLSILDNVELITLPNNKKTIIVKYNDYNRRIIIDPLEIDSVDISKNSLLIENNGLIYGEKVIFEQTVEISGLTNNKIYYISPINSDEFRLCETKYDLDNNIYVEISSIGSGYISKINPNISVTEYQTLEFDLSDNSLSYVTGGGTRKSSFRFNLYFDPNKSDNLSPFNDKENYSLTYSGEVGVSINAKVSLEINENTPKKLYYNLLPILTDENPNIKKEIVEDSEQLSNNQVNLVKSSYSGIHKIIGISSESFIYELDSYPESSLYNSSTATLSYKTNNKNISGSIGEIYLSSGGRNYKKLPSLSIESENGINGEVIVKSDSIGSINKIDLPFLGYNYSSDNTIRPTISIPSILNVSTFSVFDSIEVIDKGFSYTSNSDLVVVDGATSEVVNDVKLVYDIENYKVNIIKNTDGISNTIPTIIPVNNPNGIGVNNVVFDSENKTVTLTLDSSFSDPEDFPFNVGTRILLEGFYINEGDPDVITKNYNSSEFNYALFEIISNDPNLGGIGATITYSMFDYLNEGETLGVVNFNLSNARVVSESYFPIFEASLKKNDFIVGEKIYTDGKVGFVESWYPDSKNLIVSSKDKFNQNDLIRGETTGVKALVIKSTYSDGLYNIGPSATREKFWNGIEKGFLNNSLQRLHDNDYYQYFSYDLKSEIPIDQWNDPVSSLNHTAGFKKFSTLDVNTTNTSRFISTDQSNGTISAVVNLDRVVDLECNFNFDLAKENLFNINGQLQSNQIIFNSRIIQDYIQSVGNKVLIIDDISPQFNSKPRDEIYSIVDTFPINHRYVKYFVSISDTLFGEDSQFGIVSAVNDGTVGYTNQYATLYSLEDLGVFDIGYFDLNVSGEEGSLIFYPNNVDINNYNLSICSFSIDESLSGISTLDLGQIVRVQSHNSSIPQGTSTSSVIVSISSTFRSLKLHTLISDTLNKEYESTEINLIHDGSNVYFTDYANLQTNSLLSYSGIGTFDAAINGSNIEVSFIPNVSTASTYTVNSLSIGIGNTETSGISTEILNKNYLESGVKLIPSSPTPSVVAISSYRTSLYSSSYYVISIEDTTNNNYQLSEVVSHYNTNLDSINYVEYGSVYSGSSVGILTVGTEGSGVNQNAILYFNPDANTQYEVRVFSFVFGRTSEYDFIDLNSSEIESNFGFYFGRLSDIRKSFELTHNQNPIFKKIFDGSSELIVDLDDDTILIPNHYFVTGEEIVYNQGGDFGSPIGIATTTISGVGSTDILPETLYIVKINDLKVRVSGSSSDALSAIPKYLDLSSVGVSTNHSFTSKKQSTKSLITLNNIIQSPVVSTSKTTSLLADFTVPSTIISVDNPLQISGGDLLKIDNEIVKVGVVGYGVSNQILVERNALGSKIGVHTSGTLVQKVESNYNIVGNTIFFADPPEGQVPLENPNDPEEIDYEGLKTSATFSGRVFLRSGIEDTDITPYESNYVFDSISDDLNGYDTYFTLKSNNQDVTGVSTDNAIVLVRNIFQLPNRNSSIPISGDYELSENSGITSISFTGNSVQSIDDINTSSIPRGGIIVSVGSTQGFAYQPLVAAGGTAVVSGLGTIQSISIGNSGSGYRLGIQTTVNVSVANSDVIGPPNFEVVGIASISDGHIVSVTITNPGSGYTSSNPPYVLFDAPLSYSNIPLVYSDASQSGVGTGAVVDLVVSQDSSMLSFDIKNFGYGYNVDDILTVSIGGTTGIPTNTSISFEEFQLFVDRVYDDQTAIWHLGKLTVIDPIDDLIDGRRRIFPIRIDRVQTSIQARPGSNINLAANLLIFINDILQIPGESYIFNGGSVIEFLEAPQSYSDLRSGIRDVTKTKILFYEGTNGVDTVFVDVLETIEVGDTLRLNSDDPLLKQDKRLVNEIISSDAVRTNTYVGKGISENESLLRNVIWCKQRNDIFLASASFTGVGNSTKGFKEYKSRESYEPYINPSAYLIKNLSLTDTELFVDNLSTFFNSYDEIGTGEDQKYKIITISSQDTKVSCSATAIVSAAGTISSIDIEDFGDGYTSIPSVYISSPTGLGVTAIVTASLSDSKVSTISIVNGGSGYDTENPPSVLVDSPESNYEKIRKVSYEGDFGIITGIETTSIGIGSTGIIFDFYIPEDSYNRDLEINPVGSAGTISGIQTGYYFVVRNSNVGYGLTSLDSNGQIIGIGSTFIDNVYQVSSVSIGQTTVVGLGTTTLARVTVRVSDYNGLVSLGQTHFYGEYSWGRVYNLTRPNPTQFNVYNNGIIGITTSPIVQRYQPLKNKLYTS